jgi:hypothetical protein
MRRDEPEFPYLKPIEFGRELAPAYDTPLTTREIITAEWDHICPARFGEPRGGQIKWTGDSFRYDIFQRTDSIGRHYFALRWWNGSGEGWLIAEDKSRRGEVCLLDTLAAIPDENRRWDACHFLWETAEKTARAAKRAEYDRVSQAFVDGRLKKRKKRGHNTYKVEIVS